MSKLITTLLIVTVFSCVCVKLTYCEPPKSQVYTYAMDSLMYSGNNWCILLPDTIVAGVITVRPCDKPKSPWSYIEELFPSLAVTWSKDVAYINDPDRLLSGYRISIAVLY